MRVAANTLTLVKYMLTYLLLRSFSLQVRIRKSFYSVTGRLKDEKFAVSFATRQKQFQGLAHSFRPQLERNNSIGGLRNGAVEPEVRFLITIRIIAVPSGLEGMML